MTKERVVDCIADIGIIPGIRVSCSDDALFAVEALCAGGIPIVEIAMTAPDAAEVLADVRSVHPEVVVGAGEVRNSETAQRCIDAGAMFISSPGIDAEIIKVTHTANLAAIAGALTPTEVMHAQRVGADFVRIFPCAQVGGPPYIRAIRGPFADVRLIAAGGVGQGTITDYILAGASAVGIARELIEPGAIERRERARIRELSRRFTQAVQKARKEQRTLPSSRPVALLSR
jgi:2-dehydro-3-deoxyphosphogluconate aldolase/(4S)-4-hydroxy-2-oxoglutarate aldolase